MRITNLVVLGGLAGAFGASCGGEEHDVGAAPVERRAAPTELPALFVERGGQLDDAALFSLHGRDGGIFFGEGGATLSLVAPGSSEQWVMRVELVGARNGARPEGAAPSPTKVSYFKGQPGDWVTGLGSYTSIIYRDVWPGIDLVYAGERGFLKYTFIVRPGADPEQIRVAYRGASLVELTAFGTLRVATPFVDLEDDAPYVYQEVGGRRVEVDASYDVEGDTAGFVLGAFDRSKDLIVDPLTTLYSGVLGGLGIDEANGIAVDGENAVYLTGTAAAASFPSVVGPDTTHNGNTDAFVAKLSPLGTHLEYLGFIGGSGDDTGNNIAIDAGGNAYIAGTTWSADGSFPAVLGPDSTFGGGSDGFYAVVTASGQSLVRSSYIGGAGDDHANDIVWSAATVEGRSGPAFAGRSMIYVVGSTSSTQATLPVVGGPDLTYNGGASDAFVAAIADDGEVWYLGYIGGAGDDSATAAVTKHYGTTGSQYYDVVARVVGHTTSANFPGFSGNFGGADAFVARVAIDGSGLLSRALVGGAGDDHALDAFGDYLVGATTSPATTHAVMAGYGATYGGQGDGFVAEVQDDGTVVAFGYVGSPDPDVVRTIHGPWIGGAGFCNSWVDGFVAERANPGNCDAVPGVINELVGLGTPNTWGRVYLAGSDAPVASQEAYYAKLSAATGATELAPTVQTAPAQQLGLVTRLYGRVNPKGTPDTAAWFRYSDSQPAVCDDRFGVRVPDPPESTWPGVDAEIDYDADLTLTAGQTYYFCSLAGNGRDIVAGEVLSFSVPFSPSSTTLAATNITGSSAQLNGEATPHGVDTSGWFRYDTTDPGSCDDTFGTRLPCPTCALGLGAGTAAVPFNQALTALVPLTTYYYCAGATNVYGDSYGEVSSFTVPAAPTLVTGLATDVTTSSATLNGLANPSFADTTGWFRYSTSNPGSCSDAFGTRAPANGGTALGAGTSDAPFAEAINGVSLGTTYYYCAIAQNVAGTTVGSVQTFQPAQLPDAATEPATDVSEVAATLHGAVNPQGADTNGGFRIFASPPAGCADGAGTVVGLTGLGGGVSPVAVTAVAGNLTPAATYYYCAFGTSSQGTGYGPLLSFTTSPDRPTMVSHALVSVTSTTATIEGVAMPGGAPAVGWAFLAESECWSYGNALPPADAVAIGSGSSNVTYSYTITGLSPGTTYSYCAFAYNEVGSARSNLSKGTLTTADVPAAVPAVSTGAASAVTSTGATLFGTAAANGEAMTGWFRLGTTDPGSCDDNYGARVPGADGSALGPSNYPMSLSQAANGLVAGTTYYHCAVAENSLGKSVGSVRSFRTTGPPSVTTLTVSGISSSSATLNGAVNPNGFSTDAFFRFGPGNTGQCNTLGSSTPLFPMGNGTSEVSYTRTLSGLSPGTTYYICARATNSMGAGVGAILSFTTPALPPTVALTGASALTSTTATLNAAATPNGAPSGGWFRYTSFNPGMCTDSFGTRVPASGSIDVGAGNIAADFAQALTGLTPNTVYYYCAFVTNSEGTSATSPASFSTTRSPTVTTNAASSIGATTALLNAYVRPNGVASTGWFRYSTTSPGSCDDAFGIKAPASGASVGSGTQPAILNQMITGLTPSTTYFFCALGSNADGLETGVVRSFTTASGPPVAVTTPATNITTTSATLNGSGDPNGADTSGLFYHATASFTCGGASGTSVLVTSLGNGESAVAYAHELTGLSPGVTYYYCAAAWAPTTSGGYGSVLSFTTLPDAPAIAGTAAASITSTSASLEATANPNGDSAFGWFRYDTAARTSCDDAFGTRAPATADLDLGGGTSPAAFASSITGLTPATTYFFCAIAANGGGTAFGEAQSFTTLPSPPSVTTLSATSISATSAALRGSANPNEGDTSAHFRYSASDPGSCDDVFGSRIPAQGGTALGGGNSEVVFSQSPGGLLPATTYFYCSIAENSGGTGYGPLQSFTTLSLPPTVTTESASSILATSATLEATANPNNLAATGWLRYDSVDPGSCNDTFGTRAPTSAGTDLGSGTSAVPYAEVISGLSPGVDYYYCALSSSGGGLGVGSVRSFTTAPAAPSVSTRTATSIVADGAELNGAANPNGSAATGWLRYSATDPGTCDDTFGTRLPTSGGTSLGAGTQPVAFAEAVGGLNPATPYYYCAIAENGVGKSFGPILVLNTSAVPPPVTTLAASGLASTSVTLNGSANPSGDASSGWFRYSGTNPGICDDSFGTAVPTTDLGSGTVDVPYSAVVSGLEAATDYFACALASNSAGTSYGELVSFTTSAGPPTAITERPTSVTDTAMKLVGTADPNGDATDGWFRISDTDPVVCDDSFGTRVPATGAISLGGGNEPQRFEHFVNGLVAGTRYYFCAIAESSLGQSYGDVQLDDTVASPYLFTNAATDVLPSGATLHGELFAAGFAGTGWFRLDTTDPVACDDSFGTRAPIAGGVRFEDGGAETTYALPVTGLAPGATYYYCALFSADCCGTAFGQVQSFSTPAAGGAPGVVTGAAADVAHDGVTLVGSASANGDITTAWFRYDTTPPGSCNDVFGARLPAASSIELGSGGGSVSFSDALTGLTPETSYYYCAIAENAAGIAYGSVESVATASLRPVATTGTASNVTATSATLSAAASPVGSDTDGYFFLGTTDPGSCDSAFGVRQPATGGTALGSGTAAVAYDVDVTGLEPATAHYYCAAADNAAGTGFGAVASFTTLLVLPDVTTEAPAAIAATSATFAGTATTHNDPGSGWFRYDTQDPGACDDAFGVRAPASDGSALAGSSAAQPFAETVTGLLPGTTYFYCALSANGAGASVGSVESFTTDAALPVATTGAASVLSSSSAALQGVATPNGSLTTAYFRYGTTAVGSCDDTFGTQAPASPTELGSSPSPVDYGVIASGLSPGTTYYFCAVASNGVGTSLGEVSSFTTTALAPPTVTTRSAASVSTSGASLRGSANPNGLSTSGWFRYDTSDPGACDDTFGARVPSSGEVSLGSGNAAAAYALSVDGLVPATSYYYCALAASSDGIGTGEVKSLTTAAIPPTVTTEAAASVTTRSALLGGTVNPEGTATTAWIRYSALNPGACDDAFGQGTTASAAVGAGRADVPHAELVSGLSPRTTYYFCLIAENSAGRSLGPLLDFATPAEAPSVTTQPISNLAFSAATLNGSANPNSEATLGWFRYDTSDPGACDDVFGVRAPSSGGLDLGSGSEAVEYAEALTALPRGTTLYYCAIAESAGGTSFGSLQTFTLPLAPPTVTTVDASDVTSDAATLNSSVNPSGLATTTWFRYDTTDPSACDDDFGIRYPDSGSIDLGAGAGDVASAEVVSGLSPNTDYFFCAIAANDDGVAYGTVLSFATQGAPPAVTTTAPTDVGFDFATLNGTANPYGADTAAWFRYSDVNPVECDDSFGVPAPGGAGATLGAGTNVVAFSEAVTGLTPGAVYYFCALAENEEGLSFGEVLSFSPSAPAPSVSTGEATDITVSEATIAGAANPNGTAAVGWFRYDSADPGACDDVFGTRVPDVGGLTLGSATTAMAFDASLSGLAAGATYYYCAVASNLGGAAFGDVRSFTTLAPVAPPPSVTTLAAVVGAAGSVTLNGSANPNGTETTAWFRYDTTSIEACDDLFGTRAPHEGARDLAGGNDEVQYSTTLADMAPGSYVVCAIAESSAGKAYGTPQSFTVPNRDDRGPDTAPEDCACRETSGSKSSAFSLAVLCWLLLLRRKAGRARALNP